MLNWLRRMLSYAFGQFAFQFAIRKMKHQATLIYLKTLKVMRQSLLAAVLVFVTLQLMVIGFIGTIVIGVWLCPLEFETKLYILVGVFASLFAIPLVALMAFFSERTWLRMSKKLTDSD